MTTHAMIVTEKTFDFDAINLLPEYLRFNIFYQLPFHSLSMTQFWAWLHSINHSYSINKQKYGRFYRSLVIQFTDALYKKIAVTSPAKLFPIWQSLLAMKYLSSCTRKYMKTRMFEAWQISHHSLLVSDNPYIVKIPGHTLNTLFSQLQILQLISLSEKDRLFQLSSENILVDKSEIKKIHSALISIPLLNSNNWCSCPECNFSNWIRVGRNFFGNNSSKVGLCTYITNYKNDYYAIWPLELSQGECEELLLMTILAADLALFKTYPQPSHIIDQRTQVLWNVSKKVLKQKNQIKRALQKFVIKIRTDTNLSLLGEHDFQHEKSQSVCLIQ